MLDVYTMGTVQRISPEAPVPVLRIEEERSLPGGAGNAMLGLRALGMHVIGFGRVGDDDAGRECIAALEQEGVDCSHIIKDHQATPVKRRMIADNQQLLRVDQEVIGPPQEALPQLETLLDGVDVVAISDYAKGFLTPSLLRALIETARSKQIPVIVDPKGLDFSKYAGATVIKPNLGEAFAAAGLSPHEPLDLMGEAIFGKVAIDTLLVTRGKQGISLFEPGRARRDFAARVHEVKDVTGAGDTVLAVLCAALANGLTLDEGARIANVAAGLAIERLGCARITLGELSATLA